MNNSKTLLTALAALAVTAVVPSANAGWHSMVGDSLSPLSPSLGCFSQYNGAITNSYCGDGALAQWPIILDSAGNSKLFKVRTLGAPNGVRNVECFLDVTTPDGLLYWRSPAGAIRSNPNGATYQELQYYFNVPNNDLARFGCFLGAGNSVTGSVVNS